MLPKKTRTRMLASIFIPSKLDQMELLKNVLTGKFPGQPEGMQHVAATASSRKWK